MATIAIAEILGPDLLVILAIVFVLFGGSQVPKLARSIGSARREFEHGLSGGASEQHTDADDESPSPHATDRVLSKAELEKLLDSGTASPEPPSS